MLLPDGLKQILQRIETGNPTPTDLAILRQYLSRSPETVQQLDGKYNIYIGQGQNIQIGDRHYSTLNDNAIQAIIQAGRNFNAIGFAKLRRIAKIINFKPGLGMRGEAHFHFAEFANLTSPIQGERITLAERKR